MIQNREHMQEPLLYQDLKIRPALPKALSMPSSLMNYDKILFLVQVLGRCCLLFFSQYKSQYKVFCCACCIFFKQTIEFFSNLLFLPKLCRDYLLYNKCFVRYIQSRRTSILLLLFQTICMAKIYQNNEPDEGDEDNTTNHFHSFFKHKIECLVIMYVLTFLVIKK